MIKSHYILLLLCWLVLAGAISLIVTIGFIPLDFHWMKAIFFVLAGAVCHRLMSSTGDRLNEHFNVGVQDFIRGDRGDLKPDAGVQRVYGMLLMTLLPFLVYSLLLAVFLTLSFLEYGSLLITEINRFQLSVTIGLAIVAIGTIVAFLIAVRSLVFPAKIDIPGIDIGKTEHPDLWHLVQTTAERLGAKPIDHVVLIPTPRIAVCLRGIPILSMIGRGKQTLILGVPALHELKVNEFAAVLAHEYGHLSNRTTQWKTLTYVMDQSLSSALQALPKPLARNSGISPINVISLIVSLNPAYWLLKSFESLFLKTTRSFSRMCEVIADIEAMNLYGGPAFKNGLLQVSSNGTLFRQLERGVIVPMYRDRKHTFASLSTVMMLGKAYTEHVSRRTAPENPRNEKADPYRTHPPLQTRLDYAKRFPEVESVSEDQVTTLFRYWRHLEQRATQLFNDELIHSLGISD